MAKSASGKAKGEGKREKGSEPAKKSKASKNSEAKSVREPKPPKPAKAAKTPKAAKPAKPAKAPKPSRTPRSEQAGNPAPRTGARAADVVRQAREKATALANNPAVAEVVAATLVAAAAALKNPAQARRLAADAAEEIGAAIKGASGRGAEFWQLALDVARRSMDTLGEGGAGKAKDGKKTK